MSILRLLMDAKSQGTGKIYIATDENDKKVKKALKPPEVEHASHSAQVHWFIQSTTLRNQRHVFARRFLPCTVIQNI